MDVVVVEPDLYWSTLSEIGPSNVFYCADVDVIYSNDHSLHLFHILNLLFRRSRELEVITKVRSIIYFITMESACVLSISASDDRGILSLPSETFLVLSEALILFFVN